MYNNHDKDSSVENTIFRNNSSGSSGGCICNKATSNSTVSFDNVQFIQNSGTYRGGAIYNLLGEVEIKNCTFQENTAFGEGGAVYALNPTNIYSSSFTSNSVTNKGGAIHIESGATASLTFEIVAAEASNSSSNGLSDGIVIFNCRYKLSILCWCSISYIC